MFAYSKHLLEQIKVRGIPIATIEDALNYPESMTTEDGLAVYQKVVVEKDKP